jgi:hypothetical protein
VRLKGINITIRTRIGPSIPTFASGCPCWNLATGRRTRVIFGTGPRQLLLLFSGSHSSHFSGHSRFHSHSRHLNLIVPLPPCHILIATILCLSGPDGWLRPALEAEVSWQRQSGVGAGVVRCRSHMESQPQMLMVGGS